MFIQPFHARGQVYVFAERRIIDTRSAAEVADVRHAGVQADACDELLAVHVLRRLVAETQSGLASAQGVITLRFGPSPESENSVTDILHYCAICVLNAVPDCTLKL